MSSFVLYSTLGCHLCELAESLLNQSTLSDWRLVDISDSEALVDLYGVRIPVLKNTANEKELGWPFDLADLERWLATSA